MKILVAGIGNIFFGDDGFGVEVARRLVQRELPPEVQVKDFGIRSFDLAFALDTADLIVFVDVVARGGAPGTLYTIEPEVDGLEETTPDAHTMNPAQVLALARQMGVTPGRIVLIGCEPESFGPEHEGRMGLSAAVENAVDRAADLVVRFCKTSLEEAAIHGYANVSTG